MIKLRVERVAGAYKALIGLFTGLIIVVGGMTGIVATTTHRERVAEAHAMELERQTALQAEEEARREAELERIAWEQAEEEARQQAEEEARRLAAEEAERKAAAERRARQEAERRERERVAAERRARERAELVSVPAGQRIANTARPMLVSQESAYNNARLGPTPLANVNANYRAARRAIGARGHEDDCGSFVATVIRHAKVDPNFPLLGTNQQLAYLVGSRMWREIGNTGDVSTLEAGDIFAIEGHIFIFMGGGQAAHARLGWALPYAFPIMQPFYRPANWPARDSAEWAAMTSDMIPVSERILTSGQFRSDIGKWGNSNGVYRIFRAVWLD